MKKRLLTLLLTALLVVGLLPFGASAAGEKLIAITFDDGPSQYTSTLLDGLAARGAKVTFFMQGVNAQNYQSVVKRAWNEGHQICSHTYNHPSLTSVSAGEVQSQLSRTDAILDRALGFDARYMLRPPYGNYNQTVLGIAGVPCFYWSVDTEDWRSRNADSVYSQIMSHARDGAVVLLHDLYSTSVSGALRAIDSLKAQGYQFVTVAELFYRRGVTLQNAQIYFSAYPGSAGTASALAAPKITQSADTNGGLAVTLSGDGRGSIYYTTNGEIPNPANSTRYTAPFTLSKSCTIKAVAVVDWNSVRSTVSSQKIDYLPAAAPVLTLSGDTMTMTCATAGAEIRYTTDCSEPTAGSTRYTGPINVPRGTTVKAIATASGFNASAVSMLTYTANGNQMKDVTVKAWYYKNMDRAVSEGILAGTKPGVMSPSVSLTRAMLVSMLYRMAAPEEPSPDVSFPDVKVGSWYYKALCWATENGIVAGMPDGTFKPSRDITRAELAAMIARYLRMQGYTLDSSTDVLNTFSDGSKVAKWAKRDMAAMVTLKVIYGRSGNQLAAASGASRAEAVTMLMRAADLPKPEQPETPDPEPEPETAPVTAKDVAGQYGLNRATITVQTLDDETVKVTILWADTADAYSEWVMTGKIDPKTGAVSYSDCVKTSYVFPNETDPAEETVDYENGAGTLTFQPDGDAFTLTWDDAQEHIADGSVFTRS